MTFCNFELDCIIRLGGDRIWVLGTSASRKWPKNRTPGNRPQIAPTVIQIEDTCFLRKNTPVGLPNSIVDGHIAMTQRCVEYVKKRWKIDLFWGFWFWNLHQNHKSRISEALGGRPKSFCTFFNLIGDIKFWGSKFWSGTCGSTHVHVFQRRFTSSGVSARQLASHFSHDFENKSH